ncbi:MAG: TonB-dependent receptor, partial [Gemmatimonadota bacterium]
SINRENIRLMAEQRRRADTIMTPTPAAEMPQLIALDGGYHWNRDEMAATGALTLSDLLEGIPGLTVFRSGWIGSPHVGAMMGDFQKLRVFYDGIELDAMDPRNGGMLDLSFVQIWQLEEVRVERGASEIRVHLRSWRVRSVTPSTRVDIGTGDLETNGYRGYFGRRYRNGLALQLGASQIGTRDNRGAGDADGLSLFGRFGWAKGSFSADASFTRSTRDRTEQLAVEPFDNLPPFDGVSSEGYARVAYTDTVTGLWAQVTAAQLGHKQKNLAFSDTVAIPFKPLLSELTFTRQQYVAAGGWGRGPLSLSITGRLRHLDSLNFISPSARLAFETPRLAVAGFAEQQTERHLRRTEVSGRVLPMPWLGVSGAVSYFSPTAAGIGPTSMAYRGEVGVRLHRAWLSIGRMSRDTAQLIAPIVFDTAFTAGAVRAASGSFVSLRGKVWRDVGFDATAMKWDSAGIFRPAYQTRAQLYVNTGWLSRFPSGHLNVLFALTHEYRSLTYFPVGDELVQSDQFRTINVQLEIRLLQATLSYQFRNLLNEQFQEVPGFFMHRPVQFYGVRWYFFN